MIPDVTPFHTCFIYLYFLHIPLVTLSTCWTYTYIYSHILIYSSVIHVGLDLTFIVPCHLQNLINRPLSRQATLFSVLRVIYLQPHRWCNGSRLASSAVDCGFESRSGQTKNYEIGICCFPAKHAVLRRNICWIGIQIVCPSEATVQLSALV
jgi:hypothetical protein